LQRRQRGKPVGVKKRLPKAVLTHPTKDYIGEESTSGYTIDHAFENRRRAGGDDQGGDPLSKNLAARRKRGGLKKGRPLQGGVREE